MSMHFAVKTWWAPAALLLVAAAPLAQDRLVINVREAQKSAPAPNVVHYGGTGSVRHSEQRSYTSAQSRRSTQEAERRAESQGAQERRTRESSSRSSVDASGRTHGQASARHGSVRLDTIR